MLRLRAAILIPILVATFSAPVSSTLTELGKDAKALILIDIQNFYFPGEMLPLVNPEEASLRASFWACFV